MGKACGGQTDATVALLRRPLISLEMTSSVPGFVRAVWDVARFESRNLRVQPGLYIFVPLILLQTIGNTFLQLGAFDTPLLLTPGMAAVGSMNTLTMLVAFLIFWRRRDDWARPIALSVGVTGSQKMPGLPIFLPVRMSAAPLWVLSVWVKSVRRLPGARQALVCRSWGGIAHRVPLMASTALTWMNCCCAVFL